MKLPEDCRRFETQLEASLDRPLDSIELAAQEVHIESCEDCAALARLRQTMTSEEGVGEEVPDYILAEFWPELRGTLERRRKATGLRRPTALAIAAAFSLLLNLILSYTLWQPSKRQEPAISTPVVESVRETPPSGRQLIQTLFPGSVTPARAGLLDRRSGIRAGELMRILDTLPERTLVLNDEQAARLATILVEHDEPANPPGLVDLLAEGLSAGELRAWLAHHPVDRGLLFSFESLTTLRSEKNIRRF
jgi:hypothetical protein